jgi:hypothetical protein
LIVLVVLFAGGGMWGHSKWGWRGYSPAGLLIVVLLVALLMGAFSRA